MAYTNSGWPTNIPAGSDNLNTADDQLRRLRLDLKERLNDIVDDITTDPVVPKKVDIGRIIGIPQVAKAWTGASFALPSGADTVIDLVQETFDTNSFHDNSSNPSRLTVTDAGYYRVNANFGIISGSTSQVGILSIRKNGVVVAQFRRKHTGSSSTEGFAVSIISLAAATDYFTASLFQSSGDSWTTLNDEKEAFLMIEKLIGTV